MNSKNWTKKLGPNNVTPYNVSVFISSCNYRKQTFKSWEPNCQTTQNKIETSIHDLTYPINVKNLFCATTCQIGGPRIPALGIFWLTSTHHTHSIVWISSIFVHGSWKNKQAFIKNLWTYWAWNFYHNEHIFPTWTQVQKKDHI
jgi:hypothetical protein